LWLYEIRGDIMGFTNARKRCAVHAAWFRPGGVHQDVPLENGRYCRMWLDDRMPRLFRNYGAGGRQPHFFKQRNVGCTIVQRDAIKWGAGPMIR
jgi:NADH-quinone oxidoreductase subunit D